MPHLILQLAILIAVVFVIGSLFGSYARKRKARNEVLAPQPEQQVEVVKNVSEKKEQKVEVPAPAVPVIKADTKKASPKKTENVAQSAIADDMVAQDVSSLDATADDAAKKPAKPLPVKDVPAAEPVIVIEPVVEIGLPQLLDAARKGQPDDLLKIKGIGPTLQGKLNALGVYHYDQLAAWDAENAIWIGQQLNFRGRVEREEWVEQANALLKLAEKARAEKAPKKALSKTPAKKAPSARSTVKAATAKAAVKKAPVKTVKNKVKPVTKKI